ncbi:site-specific integrase [Brumimicrobium glaciale]|uniref:Site-specific integrase n=1 Tax=Brumimicrobium glaciale TaxID=200475 RepID=A0A4Q4KR78_9FLAO|nr:site-specific integrase [Brumimicrobium glaciale]RYM35743.1 site-specific integrase [Brumimicrobium glaciale]
MKRNQKFKVQFYPKKQKAKNGDVQLYIRIVVDLKRAEIATTHYIPSSAWNEKKRRVKPSFSKSLFLNAYIDKVINDINQIFIQEVSQGNTVTSTDIKNKYLGVDEKPTQKTILDALDYHNNKMEEKVQIGQTAKKTYTRYVITKKKVVAFMKYQYKIKDKSLSELRLRFATEFEHYLLTQDNLHTNTAHKYIKNLKTVMNMSVGLDWISSNPFKNFRCSYIAPKREVLTQEEVDRIRFKEISIKRLAEVRDVFIFCCYTGFAYADIYEFEYDAIVKGIDGGSWLKTNRKKTGVKESVPLLPVALEIIEKYREHPYCLNKNRLLPVNSNQRYNGYLKEIADICSIKKKVTSHIARHTFATTITLSNGVPIETVSSMLGHSSIRTTQIYAKVIESKVSEDMQNLKAKLSQLVEASPDQRKMG